MPGNQRAEIFSSKVANIISTDSKSKLKNPFLKQAARDGRHCGKVKFVENVNHELVLPTFYFFIYGIISVTSFTNFYFREFVKFMSYARVIPHISTLMENAFHHCGLELLLILMKYGKLKQPIFYDGKID